MKKIIYSLSISLILILSCIAAIILPSKKNENKIVVAEVAHSIFYAPLYVAKNNGYFKEEGLDIEILLTPGADKVTSAVLSGEVNIGFCGSEATIYLYNNKEKDYLINFAGLTKKDGSFIVSRKKEENFSLNNMIGKTIIGGRIGGMPEMTLEWILRQNGIDPKNDLTIDTSISFSAMGGAFISGTGDYVSLFEPTALELEKNNYGYVVASLGEIGGEVPYTVFNAKKSYIENNKEKINSFVKAIQKGLDFVHNNTSMEIAKIIVNEFADTKLEDLAIIIDRYKKIDSWYKTTYISKESFEHVKEIMINANQLKNDIPFEILVNNEFSKK